MAAQRSAEILDAFERCVARFGLDGSSLERIAQEAGMKRSILRHYVGNRDDLVIALADRVVARYREQMVLLSGLQDSDRRIDQLLDNLFPRSPIGTTESLLVMEALIGGVREYGELKPILTDYVEDLVGHVTQVLRCEFPGARSAECWTVAYGLVSICFNHESLVPLQLPAKYRTSARDSAKRLVATLG